MKRLFILFLLLSIIFVSFYLNFKLDRADYIFFEEIRDLHQLSIKWGSGISGINRNGFSRALGENQILEYGTNAGFKGDIYRIITKKKDKQGLVRGIWVNKNGIPFWPQDSDEIMSRLEYPQVLACTSDENSFCVFGLDYHFRQQSWWYQIPILRYVYQSIYPQGQPYKTQDTYLSLYKIPNKQRIVLSNPCTTKKIVAYESRGYNTPISKNLFIGILCDEGTVYDGEIILKD